MTWQVALVAGAAPIPAEPALLARAEPVHRQLRPHLADDYAATMAGIFADGGEMIVAMNSAGDVAGVAVYRCFRNTFSGVRFYVDDLVVDVSQRSSGVGKAMLAWLRQEAARRGANGLQLESGTQRTQAHKFYFREGFVINAFSFKQDFEVN
ncbi:MAG: GNAT family N-acetyltransferase [Chitinivorax sp.]|jgi:GNAT superfamily N-acetyltransferase